jgi:uncharacterized protein (DUF952 family)
MMYACMTFQNLLPKTFKTMLYHIVEKTVWDTFEGHAVYFPVAFDKERFIHLSEKHQVQGVLERYYVGMTDLLLLHLDESLFTAELKYEESTSGELFPHLYGHLNKNSVLQIEELGY